MDLNSTKEQLNKVVDFFDKELKSIQVWKASRNMVDNVSLTTSYWAEMKIPQVANIVVLDSQTLKIEPWDKKECKHIEKAIYEAELWLAPKNEWDYVFVKVPELTHEWRETIVKKIKKIWEETKWHIRQVRQKSLKANEILLSNKEISEDEKKINEENIENLIKDYNKKVDDLIKHKSEQILSI